MLPQAINQQLLRRLLITRFAGKFGKMVDTIKTNFLERYSSFHASHQTRRQSFCLQIRRGAQALGWWFARLEEPGLSRDQQPGCCYVTVMFARA